MAIYKLDELVHATRGNSLFQKSDLKNDKLYNSYVALHYGKTYKVDAVDENYSYYVNNKFYKENQLVKSLDTVLVSTSETLEDLGHSYIYLRHDIGLLGGEQILLNANKKVILPEYLYYLTKQLKQQFRKYATGMKVYRFKIDDFKFIVADIPSLKEQQEIIDIIKPIETLIFSIQKLQKQIHKVILSIPETDKKFTLSDVALVNRSKSQNTTQLSAKVLNYRSSAIKNFERPQTYKSNTYFALENSLLINTIRPKLNKYCIVPCNTDYNGTLINYNVLSNHTAILRALNSDYFWEQCILYSKGTKMPIISRDDLSNRILINTLEYEIPNIFNLLTRLNVLEIKVNDLKNETIKLLIK